MNPDKEERSPAVVEYCDRTTTNLQYAVCMEFLADKELAVDFEEWRDEKGRHEYLPDLKAFCEEQDDFWAWLEDTRTEGNPKDEPDYWEHEKR